MRRIIFLVADEHGHIYSRKICDIPTVANKFLEQKWSCFDFYPFRVGVDVAVVANLDSVLPTRMTTAELSKKAIRDYYLAGGHAVLGIAVVPKIEAGWSLFRVATYCPDIAHSGTVMTAASQTDLLRGVVRAAVDLSCRILVCPEVSIYKGSGNDKTPLDEEEVDPLVNTIEAELAGRDQTLYILGTIWWVETESKRVHNSLLAFVDGEVFLEPYEKKNWTGQELEEARSIGGTPVIGNNPFALINWHGLDVGVQICQDMGDSIGRRVDIHIVLGWGTGPIFFKDRPGGLGIYSDSEGKGRVEDEFCTRMLIADHPGDITATASRFAFTPVNSVPRP